MWVVPLLFLCACLAVLRIVRKGERASRMLALALLLEWAVANAAWLCDALWIVPVIDLYVGLMALAFRWETRAAWLDRFVQLIGVRLILHVLDGLTGHAFLVPYLHALNATFTGMLVVVADPGGRIGSGNRDGLRRLLLSLRGRLASARARQVSHGS